MSLSSYVIGLGQDAPFIAMPVVWSRAFRLRYSREQHLGYSREQHLGYSREQHLASRLLEHAGLSAPETGAACIV